MTTQAKSIPWDSYTAYREVTAHPETLTGERFSVERLLHAARDSEVLFRGWPFIYSDERFTRVRENRIETTVDNSDIRSHPYFETWQAWQTGLFFHRAVMDEATYQPALSRGKIIDFVTTVYHISEAIGSLWRLYSALGLHDTETISIEFRYTDSKDRRIDTLEPSRAPIRTVHGGADEEVVKRKEAALGVWRASDADMASSVAAEVFQHFGWLSPNTTEITKITREFLAKSRF